MLLPSTMHCSEKPLITFGEDALVTVADAQASIDTSAAKSTVEQKDRPASRMILFNFVESLNG